MKIKKIKKIILLIVVFLFLCSKNVSAETYQAKLTGNSVSLRSGPGTNHSRISYLAIDSIYNMSSTQIYKDEGGCSDGWYKINYNSSTSGYVCSTYVSVRTIYDDNKEPTTSCETEMKNSGFPSSYWSGLCSLKTSHPNWKFTALQTDLDWSSAVSSESACGLSYIATSNQDYIDSSCYNQYTKTWYPASQKAVAYYMDPRNFFSERYIFQYEYLKYDTYLSSSYITGINSILKNAEFYKYHTSLGNDFASILNNAGSSTDVNPIFLSSRILQELGSSNTLYNLYSGIYSYYDSSGNEITDLKGYYNFYNFGVSDSCATSNGTTYCGLNYAKNLGWNSIYNGLVGGSSQLSSSYIAKGQYTTYLQKFNVTPTNINVIYNHQYMTNIAAPSSESSTSYNTYKNLNLLDSAFNFYIPVYSNMSDNISNSGSGVTTPEEPPTETTIPISTLVTSSGYKYSSNYLSGINPRTNVETLKSSMEAVGAKVNITDQNGTIITSGLVGTGFKVTVSNSKDQETLIVVINGDTSGDGLINALDLLQVQKNILGTYSLTGAYTLAGDTSDDGLINALDLLQIQKNILGTFTIGQ